MTKSAVWISYDLGIRGDYTSLYAWLDTLGAKECGDSLAFLNYEHRGSVKDHLQAALKKVLSIDRQTRIYVIYREPVSNKIKGVFLFGGRGAPPWTGFSSKGVGATDEEEA